LFAARIGDCKAVKLSTKSPIELYDLKNDLGEKNNVAARHPAVVKQCEDYLKTARVDSALFPITENAGGKKAARRLRKRRKWSEVRGARCPRRAGSGSASLPPERKPFRYAEQTARWGRRATPHE